MILHCPQPTYTMRQNAGIRFYKQKNEKPNYLPNGKNWLTNWVSKTFTSHSDSQLFQPIPEGETHLSQSSTERKTLAYLLPEPFKNPKEKAQQLLTLAPNTELQIFSMSLKHGAKLSFDCSLSFQVQARNVRLERLKKGTRNLDWTPGRIFEPHQIEKSKWWMWRLSFWTRIWPVARFLDSFCRKLPLRPWPPTQYLYECHYQAWSR